MAETEPPPEPEPEDGEGTGALAGGGPGAVGLDEPDGAFVEPKGVFDERGEAVVEPTGAGDAPAVVAGWTRRRVVWRCFAGARCPTRLA